MPLLLMIIWPHGRRLLERVATTSQRVPVLVGTVLVALGIWSICFGIFTPATTSTSAVR